MLVRVPIIPDMLRLHRSELIGLSAEGNKQSQSQVIVSVVDELAAVIVVVVALIGLFAITVLFIIFLRDDNARASFGTSAVGVVGTVVGAFFGVKASSDAWKTAEAARRSSDIKAEELLRVVEPEKGRDALRVAETRIRDLHR